ncbi:Z1 domain-containing protein [Actinoplanes sp. NPDC023714]|uniref:Z1 domain-containing protein n=1 Tax=Actinoplanes sp. NPDC023714 TaxID=3154322 RepID=UPI0033F5F8ED
MGISFESWTPDLTAAVASLHEKGPAKLLKWVNIDREDEDTVTMEDLRQLLEARNQQGDPAVRRLSRALAKWDFDADENRRWDAAGTPPQSIERRQRVYQLLGLSAEVGSLLDRMAPVVPMRSAVISTNWDPWYDKARPTASDFYWSHYERYLVEEQGWPGPSVEVLDSNTTDVVRRLADPTKEAQPSKGLVVGYVQSGKTANFTGVIAKAIDAGYRLIIVMTGTIELLRSQTQRRLDRELVGVENLGRDVAGTDESDDEFDYATDEEWLSGKFISHGKDFQMLGYPGIDRLTTLHKDYQRLPQGRTSFKFDPLNPSKPFNDPDNLMQANAKLVVVKKIKSSLEKLAKDLKPLKGKLNEIPTLIIDDESDLASVNTKNPKKTKAKTEINRAITDLLRICPRGQLVMYTATPFANVFVDPDDEDDIFPKNFIVSLPRPPHYMGVRDFHDVGWNSEDDKSDPALSNERAYIRPVGPPPDPADTAQLQQREKEMRAALDSFVLAGAVKVYRENVSGRLYKHHTMLVHEATDTQAHQDQADLVRRCWREGRYGEPQALERLRRLWDADYAPVCAARSDGHPVPERFEELHDPIGEACRRIKEVGDPVLVVNSDSDVQANQQALDFDRNRVWRVLVGGAKISRGFTVEGLTISFYTRKALQADTLMQAGRWFGFRHGYRDLVRLFIRRDPADAPNRVDLYEAFEALMQDEESFREELEQYDGWDENGKPILEPWQVPSIVTQHLPYLRPTSRTKMFNAVIHSRGDAGRLKDRYGLPVRDDRRAKKSNYRAVLPLLAAATGTQTFLSTPSKSGSYSSFEARIGVVSAGEFISILKGLEWHPNYKEKVFAPVLRFYEGMIDTGRLDDVVVVWPKVSQMTQTIELPGVGVAQAITRSRRALPRLDFVGSDPKHRNALERISGADALLEDPAADALRSPTKRRGAVLVSIAADIASLAASDTCRAIDLSSNPDVSDLAILLSTVAPATATPGGRSVISWEPARSGSSGSPVVDRQD